MKKKYVFNVTNLFKKEKVYIASQAVSDFTDIAHQCGYCNLTRYKTTFKGGSSLLDLFLFIKMMCLPKKTVILYQHPMYFSQRMFNLFYKVIRKKKFHIIMLIHDLDMYRAWTANTEIIEMALLQFSKVVIAHNDYMKDYLVSKGIDKKKIVNLEIFDYLVDKTQNEAKRQPPIFGRSIIVAGNLMESKCGYLYKLINRNKDYLDIYGVNYIYENQSDKFPYVKYHGAFPAPVLPQIISGGFGLVWDGDSLEECSGNYGEYLKINNPHKTSLYLASGIPVAIWSQAALANFVEKNKVGITIDNLYQAADKITLITQEEYNTMKKNAEMIGTKLKNGEFSKKAIGKAEIRLVSNI